MVDLHVTNNLLFCFSSIKLQIESKIIKLYDLLYICVKYLVQSIIKKKTLLIDDLIFLGGIPSKNNYYDLYRYYHIKSHTA